MVPEVGLEQDPRAELPPSGRDRSGSPPCHPQLLARSRLGGRVGRVRKSAGVRPTRHDEVAFASPAPRRNIRVPAGRIRGKYYLTFINSFLYTLLRPPFPFKSSVYVGTLKISIFASKKSENTKVLPSGDIARAVG